MTARVLGGKPIAADIASEARERAATLLADGIQPKLGIVLVGDDPGSRIYTSSIERAAARVDVSAEVKALPGDSSESQVAAVIQKLNADQGVHGVIVQQPLPKSVHSRVLDLISPEKDLDGASAVSMGRLAAGKDSFAPCTARGVLELLSRSDIAVTGRHVVVVGRSAVVGRPLALLLLRKSSDANATVTVCHTGTKDIGAFTRMADILVAAMGAPQAIIADMVSEGAVVVDVGVNQIDDPGSKKGYRIVGDVAFDEVSEVASAISPVPGGVGSLTTAILVRSAVEAAERAHSHVAAR